jgi:hypothetical protein
MLVFAEQLSPKCENPYRISETYPTRGAPTCDLLKEARSYRTPVGNNLFQAIAYLA